jgi:antitoxin (DNA-binding transcriptional repressor) of toxin-antitoxin stability system
MNAARLTQLTVTEFSRGLSEFLNQVQYRGQTLDISRGKKVVARVTPSASADGYAINQLDTLLAQGQQLSAAERLSMASDVRTLRARLGAARDPWAV